MCLLFYVCCCSLTRGQGGPSKEKDKCQKEQGGAVNNWEAIPGEPGKGADRSP